MRTFVQTAFLLLAISAAIVAQTAAEMKAAGEAERAAVAAYKRKAFSEFLEQITIADRNRPNHPRLIYNLAVAYTLNGRSNDALRCLDRLAKMGLAYAIDKDEDLQTLREDKRFRQIAETSALNAKAVGRSMRAVTLSDRTLIAESVALDPADKTLYIGSIHRRKIVAVGENGIANDFSGASDGLYAVLGMKVDKKRNVLWAATSAVPQMQGFTEGDKGRSGIVEYDLKTRKLLRKYLLPAGEQHMLGDLWVDPAGNVYATDSVSPAIYRFDREKKTIEPFITSDLFTSLQGIAEGANPDEIFVADYSKGIFRIHLTRKTITQLTPAENVTLLGIDGLYYHDGRLIAIQNGINPNRVAAFTLDGDNVTNTNVLEANHPDFLEPTLGVISGRDLIFVANSQWPLVNEKAELQNEKLRDPVVLRLSLKK